MSNIIQTSSKQMMKCRVLTSSSSCLTVHLVMQTVAEAGLNTLGSPEWSPASELCKKLHSFSFARCLWVTHTNTGVCQRNTSHPAVQEVADSILFWQTLDFEVMKGEMKTHQKKSHEKPIYFFIWWSKNVSEMNKIQSLYNAYFSCLDFPASSYLKRIKIKYTSIYICLRAM